MVSFWIPAPIKEYIEGQQPTSSRKHYQQQTAGTNRWSARTTCSTGSNHRWATQIGQCTGKTDHRTGWTHQWAPSYDDQFVAQSVLWVDKILARRSKL